MRLGTVGLIVNPVAGLGAVRNLELAARVIEMLGADQVFCGPGSLGGVAIPQAQQVAAPDLQGRAMSQWLARELASKSLDALVVVGGDGTMADVAFALLEAGSHCPILGIGAGSTNVGNLITCRAGAVEALGSAKFSTQPVDALVASCNDRELALAFNDVVIGTTIVGTLAGQVCDLDAVAFLRGERKLGQPHAVGSHASLVAKATQGRVIEVARGMAVGTVIAGFAHHDHFYGKAIAGAVCLSDLAGWPAGCLVCTQPLVRTQLAAGDLAGVEPIHSSYVSLGAGETIEATGIGSPAVLCADGNPLKVLEIDDRACIRLHPNAVHVLQMNRERV